MVNSIFDKLKILTYKNRFLYVYIIIGLISLIIEQTIISTVSKILINDFLSNLIGFICGVIFAFFFNSKFNFKVPKKRLFKSLVYFFSISFLSLITQQELNSYIELNTRFDRYIISGILFFFFYLLHRNTSFKSRKQAGLAIHLNNSHNISELLIRVENYPDFIHVDLIDESMNAKNIATDLKILKEIIRVWPEKEIQLHLMSINHGRWLRELEKFKDYIKIFIHDDEGKLIANLKKEFPNLKLSIVITENSVIDEKTLEDLDEIICLCVKKPGYSGQDYSESMNSIIEELISLRGIYKFKITLDGGITNKIASRFDVEKFVSSSFILNSENSKKMLVDLQTANKYSNYE